MGWLPVLLLAAVPLDLSLQAVALLGLGGLVFTTGFIWYAAEKPNPLPGVFGFHELWHCFVLVGALCHYLFIYSFVIK
jgi:hemolysin III